MAVPVAVPVAVTVDDNEVRSGGDEGDSDVRGGRREGDNEVRSGGDEGDIDMRSGRIVEVRVGGMDCRSAFCDGDGDTDFGQNRY